MQAARGFRLDIVGGFDALIGEPGELDGDRFIPAFMGNLPAEPCMRAQSLGGL